MTDEEIGREVLFVQDEDAPHKWTVIFRGQTVCRLKERMLKTPPYEIAFSGDFGDIDNEDRIGCAHAEDVSAAIIGRVKTHHLVVGGL